MAITAEQRTDILELIVLMFDAAPGASYLSDITSAYESIAGTHEQKLQGLAFILSNTGVFQSLHPNFQTSGEVPTDPNNFATDFLSTLQLENHADARLWVVAKFGDGSPAAKASIMYQAWAYLNTYDGTDPALLNARAIMENKAEVSEYFSVTLGESAFDLATLQDVIADVDGTQESVDAALDEIREEAAELRVLTPENDLIDVLNNEIITIEGIVDFDAEGNPIGTFNPGDNINGNGFTDVNLVVVEGGDAGFMRLTEIEEVNIEAGDNAFVQFNAAGWTDVGSVNLNSGVDGMAVSLDNLEAGTVISVSDVTGSIMASYDTDSGNAWLWMYSGNEGGEGVTGVATAEGDITVEGSESISVSVWNNTGVTLGDVNVTVGNESWFSLDIDDSAGNFDGDFAVGEVNVSMGDDSDAWINVDDGSLTGDFFIGAATITVGDDSTVDVEFDDGEDGTVTIGALDVEMGDSANFTLSFDNNESVDIEVGNVAVVAGDEAELDVWVWNNDYADIVFGDIALEGGLGSTINVTFDGYGASGEDSIGQSLTVGNVTLTAGDATTGDDGEDSYVNLRVSEFGAGEDAAVDFADISLVAGTGGTVDVSFSYIESDLDIGNVHLEAQDRAEMTIYEATGDVTVGNVDIMSEGVAFAWIAKSGMGMGEDEVGAVTVGDVTIHGGATNSVSFDVQDYNQVDIGNVEVVGGVAANLEVEAEGNLGNIEVGNVMVSATAESGWAGVTLTNDSNPNAGNITAGDLTANANGDNGSASISITNDATAYTTVDNTGTSVGNISVGNVTVSVGAETDIGEDFDGQDGEDVAINIENYAWMQTTTEDSDVLVTEVGSLSVGVIDVTVGDGFVSGTLTNDSVVDIFVGNQGYGGAGAMSVDGVGVHGGDFLAAYIELLSYAHTEDAVLGDMTIGNVDIDGGESSLVDFDAVMEVHSYVADLGDMTVGNFDVDVAQDSLVNINISHSISSADDTLGSNVFGDLTVGDMDITMGDNAEVNIYVSSYVSYDSVDDAEDGNFTVGDITVAVSATESEDLSGGSNINVDITRSAWNDDAGEGIGGDFTLGDVTLSAEGDEATINVDVYNAGSWDEMGDTNIGMISAAAANTADIDITVLVANYTTGEMGNVTMGGITINMGDDGEANATIDILAGSYAGDMGDVSIGDWIVNVGDGNTVYIDSSITQTAEGDDIGNYSMGDVMITAGDTSTISMTYADVFMDDGDVGNVVFGDFSATIGEDSSVYFSPSVSAANGGDIGDITIGTITANIDEGAYLSYSFNAWGDTGVGDVTVGAIEVDAAAGSTVGFLAVSVTSENGSIGEVNVGNVDIDLEAGALMTNDLGWGSLYFSAQNDIGGVTVGDVSIEASDGAVAEFSIYAYVEEGQAGDMVVGDIYLGAMDEGVTLTTTSIDGTETITTTFDVGAEITLWVSNLGDENDDLTVGDVTIAVEGAADATTVDLVDNTVDSVQLYLTSNGDVVIGDVTVSGKGVFYIDNADHSAEAGASFILVEDGDGTGTANTITIGDIDFSGYENDIELDLSWTNAGADNITAGSGDDTIYGNDSDNTITGSEGADLIFLGDDEAGNDTVVTSEGDSGLTEAEIDTIDGFIAVNDDEDETLGDLLDFNHVAGTAGNYVEDSDGVSDLDTFLDDAAANLNSTVRYYSAYDSGANLTYVAVNYGSGEADLVVALVGDHIDSLTFANFIA